jgi:ligand-binding sensor domain-containing protein/DNA-binding NarL/FixJ family response regulator
MRHRFTMKRKYLIVVIFEVFCGLSTWCQTIDFTESPEFLTITEGLSHNTVHCLLEDSRGYVWVGTQYGLDKYDGYSCKRVEGETRGSLLDSRISALFEDSKGNIWVGTAESGIFFQSFESDYLKQIEPSEISDWTRVYEITSFYEDSEGFIWITSMGGGIVRFHPETGESIVYTTANSGLSENVVFDVVEDENGVFWVATSGWGLNRLRENGRFEMSHEEREGQPNMNGYRKKLLLDGKFLWIATQGTGLYRMDTRNRTYERFSPDLGAGSLSSNSVMDIIQLTDGSFCVATDGGGLNICLPDSSADAYRIYNPDTEMVGMHTKALYCLMEDCTGNVWIGSFDGGVTVYKSAKPLFHEYAPGRPGCEEMLSRSVLSVAQTDDGYLWIGTDAGGVNRVNPEYMDFDNPPFMHNPEEPASLAGNVVKTLFEDRKQRLWLGMYWAGLDLFDPGSGSFEHILGEPYSVWSITERPNGCLWAGTMGEGIVNIDPVTFEKEVFKHDADDSGSISDNNVMSVCAQGNDRVWVGTADQGLDCWVDQIGGFEHYRSNPEDPYSISDDAIRCIFLSRSGELWIGTGRGGVNRWLGNGRFQRIGRKEGLIGNSIMGIAEDTSGMLWISTIEGISRMNPSTLQIQNYDFRTAKLANQFNQEAILATRDNRLFFGGIYGLHSIHGEKPGPDSTEARLLITHFELFNEKVMAGQAIHGRIVLDRPIEDATQVQLSAQDNSIAFEFAAMRFGNVEGLQYAFMLEGFDDSWTFTKMGEHRASYTNLDPGDYVFRVKCRNLEKSVQVHISPPYWETWWFRGLASVLIGSTLCVGVFFIKRRREEIRKKGLLHAANEKLKAEAEVIKSRLLLSATQIIHKNEFLRSIRRGLNDLRQKKSVTPDQLVQTVNSELRNQETWEEFDSYLQEFDKKFLQTLQQIHPGLTPNDVRLCSLLRMNMNTKEIATLFNISGRAVEQARYRLKKRLELDKNTDLNTYIVTL